MPREINILAQTWSALIMGSLRTTHGDAAVYRVEPILLDPNLAKDHIFWYRSFLKLIMRLGRVYEWTWENLRDTGPFVCALSDMAIVMGMDIPDPPDTWKIYEPFATKTNIMVIKSLEKTVAKNPWVSYPCLYPPDPCRNGCGHGYNFKYPWIIRARHFMVSMVMGLQSDWFTGHTHSSAFMHMS